MIGAFEPRTSRRDALALALAAFGVLNLLLGLAMALAPGWFFASVGPYGVRNDHYLGDLATWYVAAGTALLVAARYASWRVPVLALATLQGALHAVNHLVDVGEARPYWIGPFNLVSLTVLAVLLGVALAAARRRGGRR